jgi:hypothetical protein
MMQSADWRHFLRGVRAGGMAALTRIVYGSTFRKGLPRYQTYRSPEPAHANAD